MSAVLFRAAGMLLDYPDETLLARLPMIEQAALEAGVAEAFAGTIVHLRARPLMDAQAWHVQEFDLSRRHALHLTYWTDGDTRRRGEVLAAIKQLYRQSGLLVDLQGELPDYLPMVLEFATRDPARGRELLDTYRPSLELLRLGLEKDDIPHAGIITALCQALGGTSARTRDEIRQRMAGPPTESVGLEPVLLPYPRIQGG